MNEFSNLPLTQGMTDNLDTLGYKTMTPIQKESLPVILNDNDILAQAKTGSGKTAAFGIGLLDKLDVKLFRIGSMVLCPTRELADQVSKELRKIARHIHNVKILTLSGGTPIGPQLQSLEHGAHIIVGTPGRIKDHLGRGTLNVKHLKVLVFDEADRMLDMGFLDAINEIVDKLPVHRQTMLFSATYPDSIEQISRKFQTKPVHVKVEAVHESQQIKQAFIDVSGHDKQQVMMNILGHYEIKSALVFCQTKQACDDLADALHKQGYFVEALHGDLDQQEREKVLALFSNGSLSLLIATDVAARGIDIKSLQSVINYDLSRDPEVHVHRIGRTGRHDQKGIAISLISDKDHYRIERIEKYMNIMCHSINASDIGSESQPPEPAKSTIRVEAGKKNKMRPGDIVGALTRNNAIPASAVGNINIFPYHSMVAIERHLVKKALIQLNENPVKGRQLRSRILN